MSQVTGALTLELDLDRLAEKVAARVVELLATDPADELRGAHPAPRHTADSDPLGEPLGGPPGRRHPDIPTTPEETLT